jgi:hypothetical protein
MKPRPHARKRSRKKPETKRKRVRKSPAQSPAKAPAVGALVQQPHGGALRNGSQPGTNAGGTGRPPSQIRAAYAHSFDQRRYIYEEIADDPRERSAERRAALDSMGKFGLGDKPLEVADIRQHPDAIRFMAAFRQALTLELSPEVAERVTAKVDTLLQEPGEK